VNKITLMIANEMMNSRGADLKPRISLLLCCVVDGGIGTEDQNYELGATEGRL